VLDVRCTVDHRYMALCKFIEQVGVGVSCSLVFVINTVRMSAGLLPVLTRVYPKISGLATWSENCK
jgi:hypothetical protein